MVRQKGLEPPTYCLEGSCSIRMSYWRGFGAGDENRTRIPSLEGWCPDHCATPARPVRYVSLAIIAGFRALVKDFLRIFSRFLRAAAVERGCVTGENVVNCRRDAKGGGDMSKLWKPNPDYDPSRPQELWNMPYRRLSNELTPEELTELLRDAEAQQWKALDLNNTNISELPETITRLSSLQALDLSNTSISEVPETIRTS